MSGYAFALAGNPNCGKTTLFNRLTGSSAAVGNWPGVTVERKVGYARRGGAEARVVDLPGVYSLSPYTPEEALAGNYLTRERPDLIINIVDASNLDRNLYLTTELMELDIPVVIALNMMDVVEKRGDSIDCALLSTLLGIAVVPVCASRGEGLGPLLDAAFSGAGKKTRGRRIAGPSPGSADPDLELAEARYRYIASVTGKAVKRHPENGRSLSERIDAVATNRVLAIPLFFCVLLAVFWVTFGSVGSLLVRGMDYAIGSLLSPAVNSLLAAAGASAWARSLIVDGVIAGVGAVLRFLPQILLLFLLLSLLEDSGYMARAAFIMDAPMRKIGLSGRSFVPLIMGFGCTVPAVMGTRILESGRDRKLTALIAPFMSCSAKMPVYALFVSVFFPGKQAQAVLLLYAFGILMGLLSSLLFKNSFLRGEPAPFLMELPDYRFPTAENIRVHVGRRIRDFLQRAGTTVFAATVLVWLLQSVTPELRMTSDGSRSLLAAAGRAVAPLFRPCGFGDWKAAVALLSGLVAKESIVSSFGVLFSGDLGALRGSFTPVGAVSFLIFVLLYTPCVAALAAIRRETGGLRWMLVSAVYQFAAAWYASAMFYQCALLVQKLAGP